MAATLGLLFGIISMLSFGFQDALMVKTARLVGSFRASFYVIATITVLMIPMAVFLLSVAGIQTLVIAAMLSCAVISPIGLISFNKGLQTGNAAIVATVASAYGAVTAILSVIFFGEHLTLLQMAYVAVIVVGTMLVSFQTGKVAVKKLHSGVGYAVVALLAWGGFFFLIAYAVKGIGWFSAAFLVSVATLAVLLLYSFFTKNEIPAKKQYYPLLIGTGVLNLIAFFAYNLGVTYNYTSIVAPISAAAPVIVILFSVLVLKEQMANNQKLGVILVLAGLILLSV